MLLDSSNIGAGARLHADLCIVGAGPAGLTTARELAGLGIDVLLLESGSLDSGVSAQDLNEGSVEGDAYAGLRSTRHRAVGGSVRLWNTPVRGEPGAKYVPLDDTDFMARQDVPLAGWPFDRSALVPYYERAHRRCALGSFAYDVSGEGPEATADPRLPHQARPRAWLPGESLVAKLYRFGAAHVFTGTGRDSTAASNLDAIIAADNVTLLHNATVTMLRTSGRRVTGLDVVDRSGRPFRVEASTVVLAGGAIENARLLLASADAPWSANEWVGRCFMEHPRDYSLTLVPRTDDWPAILPFFDTHESADGTLVAGRIALTRSAILDGRLPNASVTLLPRLRSAPARGPLTVALDALRRRGRSRATEGYGWSEAPDPAALYDAFRLILNVEQWPHAENRITLAPARDRFGVPRARLHWRWRPADDAALVRIRSLIARDIEAAGLGTIRPIAAARIDPNAHHHSGTTRMHTDPRHGVTDADGRVHDTDNLFVMGASLFPTAGFANPTLTIVALAIRLADRLAAP